MYTDDDGKKYQIKTLSVKNVYRRLIVEVSRKEPAAERKCGKRYLMICMWKKYGQI